ncbi:MAG TPA: 3D domain-containing protein [Acidimicrobiales bacterium]
MSRAAAAALLGICFWTASMVGVGFGPAGATSPQAPLDARLDETASITLAAAAPIRDARYAEEKATEAAEGEAKQAAEAARLASVERLAAQRAARVASSSRSGERGRYLGTFSTTCYALSGRTASGHPVSNEVVAVDPRVIPLGTRIYIEGIGERVARDTGGAIKGNKLDIWNPSSSWCLQFGRRNLDVWIVG